MATFRAMKYNDIENSIDLWKNIKELGFSPEFDTKDRILRFLQKNPNLSTVAESDEKIVGTLLCGSDGRRGFIYHTGVDKFYRRKHIAKNIVERSIKMLKEESIDSCFFFTNDFNHEAQIFWKAMEFNHASHVMYHSRAI